MPSQEQRHKAQQLLAHHQGGTILVLPNIWDPLGARILESKGFPAVATASAAVSASLGYGDGQRIRRSTLLDLVARIAASVSVPVTVDYEAGYADSPEELVESVKELIASGAVGLNIEDSIEEGGALRSIEDQCERLRAVRDAASVTGIPIVLNARVDSFLSSQYSTRSEKLKNALERATAYSEAGADCIYPIGPSDRETVGALRDRIDAPINILGSPGGLSAQELEGLGINRVSFGPYVFRALIKAFSEIADTLADRIGGCDFEMMTGADVAQFLRDELE